MTKRMSMALGLSVLVGTLALLGCKTTAPTAAQPAASIAVAKQACEVNALAEERDAIITTINAGTTEQSSDIKENRDTILREKLRDYRAEVEASYRFVTASCNSYNLCMEKNGYSEQACAQTRAAWVASHEKFNALSIAIDDHKHHGGGHHGGNGDHGSCSKATCGAQGGIFASGCCTDGD